jgi:hypothetical protein
MNLKPVDFKAVAAKGCIVYCYLRSKDDKNGKKFSPYYIGISKRPKNRHYRIFEKHNCEVPSDKLFARILRVGSEEECYQWESLYVARYGLIKDGGILENSSKGGQHGAQGHTQSASFRKSLSRRMNSYGSEFWDKVSWSNKLTQTEKDAKTLGVKPARWAALSKADRAAVRYFISAHPEVSATQYLNGDYVKKHRTEEGKEKQRELANRGALKKRKASAEAFGIPFSVYEKLSLKGRNTAKARFKRGKRGAELTAGLITI